ncbi:exopolysaccharide biosynthesis protein, WecB/TagA/CpsF family [Synechococcus sp. PCC 7502]|uniref:WecB/TagA/CpsF family glycosyltransferase n=1 Tax=Synechococcus sp. PCC 7502 TaxID=1173263 RepID=UPI00029F8F22|nr:WecB/TagA/CpsF family glycosyltransferase [Synechococcus sp. PCC 7502]AFY74633.1 exopolysaccharide biosynthesis protein, WecB/TagA/CpsF family [Synechococcus sp. PCC 7502]
MKSAQSYQVLKTNIQATSYNDACDRIEGWVNAEKSCYIVAANVHVVMTGYWDRKYQRVLDHADLVTPDGMPLVWALRLLGATQQPRVYGPDLMLAWCDRSCNLGYSIYLYGSTEQTLENLKQNLKQKFPTLAIAGSYSPPFTSESNLRDQLEQDCNLIKASGAKVIFVGLGCPKQEYWMAEAQGKINAVMIGVGAAFDFHGGQVTQAPRWMMGSGLEWLYRLRQEPQRLWRRYLINNPIFIILFLIQFIKQRIKTKNIAEI